MPLKTFATLDEVPEESRESAIETKAGTFVLVIDEDTGALKSALDEERTKREAAERNATKAAKALQKAELEAKQKAAGFTQEQIDAMRADVRRDVDAEYAPVKEQAEKAAALDAKLQALLLTDRIKAQMAASGVRAERIDALYKLAGDRFALTADEKPMLKDQPGIDLTVYVRDTLKAEFPEFYAGTQATGGDAPGSTGLRLTPPASGDNISPEARITAARMAGKAA
jgi:hypothetical protein